jgi:hypothetical protein
MGLAIKPAAKAIITAIGPERQQAEQRAQNILALGNPGDRFHVQGMQREQSRHEPTAPRKTRDSSQKEIEEQGVAQVEDHIDEVVEPRIRAGYLAIQHERKPCERVPVGGMERSERPG